MISYREGLSKIGIEKSQRISYNVDFYSKPKSLRKAIESMSYATKFEQATDIPLDEVWTDEVQGVAWDGANWLFSCNAAQGKPGVKNKSLFVFKGGGSLKDDTWLNQIEYINVPHPFKESFTESDDHYGPLTYYEGKVYVAHTFHDGPYKSASIRNHSNVIVFRDVNGNLEFERWITLEPVKFLEGKEGEYAECPEFVGINPWDGLLYSAKGEKNPEALFAHSIETGDYADKKIIFKGGKDIALYQEETHITVDTGRGTVDKVVDFFLGLADPVVQSISPTFSVVDLPCSIQGACFSPNGHIYITCDVRLKDNKPFKAIAYISALNGQLLNVIPVLAEDSGQELEGLCFADITLDNGARVQIHAVLLENRDAAKDNIFLKGFSANFPDLV